MQALTVLLLGLATNLDNLCIGFLFGIQRKRIPFIYNLLIAALSAISTFVSCFFATFTEGFGRLPDIIGGILLIALGIMTMLPSAKSDAGNAIHRVSKSTGLGPREGLVLGWSLAINCIPVSFGAGLTGVSPLLAAIGVGLFSLLFVGAGNQVGLRFRVKISEQWLSAIAGLLLVAFGIIQILF